MKRNEQTQILEHFHRIIIYFLINIHIRTNEVNFKINY